MNCEWAILCEDIQPHGNWGFSIIGVFSQITAEQIPTTVPTMQIALRLVGSQGESGTVTANVMDPDGERIGGDEVHVTISALGHVDVTVDLGPVRLRRYGVYAVHVGVDGDAARTVRFAVNPVQRPQ